MRREKQPDDHAGWNPIPELPKHGPERDKNAAKTLLPGRVFYASELADRDKLDGILAPIHIGFERVSSRELFTVRSLGWMKAHRD